MRLVQEEMTPLEVQAKKDAIAAAQEKIKDATRQLQTAKSPLDKKAAQSALAAAKEDDLQAKATQENISEEAGRKFTTKESIVVGREVVKPLIIALRDAKVEFKEGSKAQVVSNRDNTFKIKVMYAKDGKEGVYEFSINPNGAKNELSIKTPDNKFEVIADDVSVPTGGSGKAEIAGGDQQLTDKLKDSTAIQKFVEEPTDDEYDQMAAMEPESDPSQINKYIPEGMLQERAFNINGLGTFEFTGMKDGLVMGSQNNGPVRSFRKEKVLQDNPDFFKRQPRERKPREKKPQGVVPYTEEQYREVLQGAIDDAGSTEFASDLADSMIYDPQILARLATDYPGESAKELKQQLQYDLEACDAPDDDYDDDYEGEVAEAARPDYRDFDEDGNEEETMKKALQDKESAEGVKDFFKDPMHAADARGWIDNKKLSDSQKRDKIKAVMKDPSKFNELMNAFTDELDKVKNRFSKNIREDLDLGHEDDEPGMLLGDIYGIMQSAKSLYELISQFEGHQEVDFPHWWQAKIVNAKANLSAARQYLDYEVNKPQQVNIAAVALQERKKK